MNIKALIVAPIIAIAGSMVALLCVVLLSQAVPPIHQLWFVGLVLVLMFSAMGGFIVALIAGRRELMHALVVALPFLAISLGLYPGTEFKDVIPGGIAPGVVPSTPPWHDTAVYILILGTVPAALWGGHVSRALRKRL